MAVFSIVSSAGAQRPDYPPTRVVDVVDELHGVKIRDPYRWLENGDAPEVQDWIKRQNQLTRAQLDQFDTQRAQLAERLSQLLSTHVGSTPEIFGSRRFFLRRSGLQDHALLYVCEDGPDAEPRVVLDPNTFSPDGTTALDWWFPSPDGRLIAYGKSPDGSENSVLHVRDVDAGTDIDQPIPYTRHAAVAWEVDGRAFTYTRLPIPGSVPAGDECYYQHLYFHALGTDWRQDAKVWGDGHPKEELTDITNSGDDRYQFLRPTLDWAKNDLYIRATGTSEFRPVAVGLAGQFSADVLGERLFILTDYQAPRYRVVAVDIADPRPENWVDVIPEQKGVIDALAIVDGKLVVNIMENAYSRVLIHEPDGKLIKEIELPMLGSVDVISGRPDRGDLYFGFQSFAYPPVVFHYDLRQHTMEVIDRLEIDLPAGGYETRQVWFNSKDGTRVPMFVTHKSGLVLDGNNPTVLSGYGGFDINLTPVFNRAALPWLDGGGVWAVANIRGGGEFGSQWHADGRLEKKQNCFDDFIAAAEKLIADGYTCPERLGGSGGSNGGLLMGAMMVQRPDLFRAIYCAVPLLDMLRYQNFSIARFWIPEYGSAENAEQFEFLRAYSPYHHVQKGVEYPAVLFATAESDSRVDPMHACKMAAALQAATVSERPILLWVEQDAGHGAGQPLSKYISKQLDQWTFFMWQLGLSAAPAVKVPTSTAPSTAPAAGPANKQRR